MTKLSSQWLTDGILDFEYKKYVLLAYLQHVREEFNKHVLFPHLVQVREHYDSSVTLKESQISMRAQFPKDLTGVDPAQLRWIYQNTHQDGAHLEEIGDILEFAIPQFSQLMQEGQSRYDEVKASLKIMPIGIVPLRTEEGYLFVYRQSSREATIYRYQVTLFDARRERIIQTQRIDSMRKNLSTTFENMKVELTRRYTQLPNPATYMVESPREYPVNETLLPAAKHLMAKYLSKE
ncbi:hypothetical protein [Persicitalea jodogahamensis]|uniref:Uncharacterized protein n=1 Tax=Persicitalea jodogahamensis TaxID=402147 RepID=A0A8J3D5F7_9BACT|nr:hypothetical protein [Persicitalea jodogahamensis]GHB77131.1 hypothetical protein GCM10007390_33950 [Persicitalea jodogahamensis]